MALAPDGCIFVVLDYMLQYLRIQGVEPIDKVRVSRIQDEEINSITSGSYNSQNRIEPCLLQNLTDNVIDFRNCHAIFAALVHD